MLLAGDVVLLQGCGEAQPAGAGVEPVGSGVVIPWGRVDKAGKITKLDVILLLGTEEKYWSLS